MTAKLIVGLGNPGREYKNTKHNVGFAVVEALAKELGVKISEERHLALIGRGALAGGKIVLALPQTYMNLSGKSVGDLVAEEIKSQEDLLVICDDVNLSLGRIRIRKKGSAGGQKGLESVIGSLGTDAFPRLRVGIATTVHKGDITDYVLSPFKKKERRNALRAVKLAKEAAMAWLDKGLEAAMSRFNKARTGAS
jgi:PTH1 family peptidyl-tRNA hydrolase